MFWKQMYALEVDKLTDLRITWVVKENPTTRLQLTLRRNDFKSH